MTITFDEEIWQIILGMLEPTVQKFLEGKATILELEQVVTLNRRIQEALKPFWPEQPQPK